MFGELLVAPTVVPSPLEGDAITLEGHELRVVEIGQGDIAPTAVLHIPVLDAVIAGDVAYNDIHPMPGFGSPAEWERWIASLDALKRLHPRIVVAGHKTGRRRAGYPQSPKQPRLHTRLATVTASAGSAEEIVGVMRAKYPDFGNLTTLMYSAQAAFNARSG